MWWVLAPIGWRGFPHCWCWLWYLQGSQPLAAPIVVRGWGICPLTRTGEEPCVSWERAGAGITAPAVWVALIPILSALCDQTKCPSYWKVLQLCIWGWCGDPVCAVAAGLVFLSSATVGMPAQERDLRFSLALYASEQAWPGTFFLLIFSAVLPTRDGLGMGCIWSQANSF